MRTTPVVSFGLYALEVKQDSNPSADDLQPFSKVADLKTGNTTSLPYASFEPDFWLLDGGYKFLPANVAGVHVGLMSLAMSDVDGNFDTPPVLTIDFSAVHTSDGLTLTFAQYSGDFASLVDVAYYDDEAALIRQDSYTPLTAELSTGQAVENFKQIVITFHGTNRPYRYLRLTSIDYGTLIYFTGSQVKAASVVEEIDVLSGEARYNTCELRLYSADAAFSIINPDGVYAYLQERQPIAIHEVVGNQSVFMGQYYLDVWKNNSETEIEFDCIDLLGVLDTITYEGAIWSGTAIETVIADILEPINVPYDLDANLYGIQIAGWLPFCSYREALQQIALAVGAYLDCSRSTALKIYQAPDLATATIETAITRAQKGAEQTLSLKPLVTGVEVTAHNYVSLASGKQVFSGTLAVGVHTITFDEPLHNYYNVTGATIVSSGVNHVVLNVAVGGAVSVWAQVYLETRAVFSVYTTGLPAGTKPNVLKVTDATLVSSENGAEVCQRVYDYYQQRLAQKLKLYASTIQPGDIVSVETLYGQTIKAVVERMAINLSGGMVATVELSGVVDA